jgi:uncharacterized BrkB/YihY/UPF0761 family membrane protein
MFVEHLFCIVPLAGSSRPEAGFWLTLLSGIIAAWAARSGITTAVKIINKVREYDNPRQIGKKKASEGILALVLTSFFIYITIVIFREVSLSIW